MIDSYCEDIKTITRALELSHASRGGMVSIVRPSSYLLNPNALSTINAWSPKHKIIQTSMLDLAQGGDGSKSACFIFSALLHELRKIPLNERYDYRQRILEDSLNAISEIQARSRTATQEDKLSLETQDLGLASALYEAVSLSNGGHVSLEKGESTDVKVDQTDSLVTDVVTLALEQDKILKGPMIALFGDLLLSFDQVIGAMEQIGSFEGRPLLICAPMISKDIRSAVALNNHKGVLDCTLIESPRVSWGKGWMDDLASFTGATVYEKNLHGDFEISHYGSALEITLKKDQIIVDPYEDHIDATAERAEQLLKEASSCPYAHTRDLLKKRAYALLGSLVRVKIGGATELEAKIRRGKAEKLLLSVSDMHKNGCVNGLIPTLAEISQGKDSIFYKALREPWRVICRNQETFTEDPSVLALAPHPFPTGRAVEIIRKAVANALTISNVEVEIPAKRKA